MDGRDIVGTLELGPSLALLGGAITFPTPAKEKFSKPCQSECWSIHVLPHGLSSPWRRTALLCSCGGPGPEDCHQSSNKAQLEAGEDLEEIRQLGGEGG